MVLDEYHIKIRNLKKGYTEGGNERVVFENLHLDIRRGECISLLGRSGSGKSTLLNLISGIDLPDTGSIHVDNQIINGLSESKRTQFRRRDMGFIFQFFNLINTLTVEENVFLPLALNGLDDELHRQHAVNLLHHVGLEDRLRSFPERLSGGEQQRLAVVRALVHQPSIILADEPTGNLDADTGLRVLKLLLKLACENETTVIIVTHSEEIAAYADRKLLLQAGRLLDWSPS